MHAEKSNHTISRMARLLEVSRSGYYAWVKRVPSKQAVRPELIEQKVAWFHGESDEVSGGATDLGRLARGWRDDLTQDDAEARVAWDLSEEMAHHDGDLLR